MSGKVLPAFHHEYQLTTKGSILSRGFLPAGIHTLKNYYIYDLIMKGKYPELFHIKKFINKFFALRFKNEVNRG
jgi:hypothetical protein